jgi:hypothetical protein
MEKITNMICITLMRLFDWASLDLTGFWFFDFLFAIFHLILMCFFQAAAIAFSSSSMVTGFVR